MNPRAVSIAAVICASISLSAQNGQGTDLTVYQDTLWLDAATVAAAPPPVRVNSDTVVYNARVYLLESDACLDDVLRKIPGLEVAEDGSIYLNGKEIKTILVDGRRYFGGDVKAALRNLPANMIQDVKAYERESDLARISGVDDGEQQSVLDVSIRKNMMDDWHNNVSIGGGSESRYGLRAAANRIGKASQSGIVLNADNLGTRPGITAVSRNQLGRADGGDSRDREIGFNHAFSTDKVMAELSARYTGAAADIRSQGRTQSIQASKTSYGDFVRSADSGKDALRVDGNFTYRPSKTLTFNVKPVLGYRSSNSISESSGSTYDEDPLDAGGSSARLNSNTNKQDKDERRLSESIAASLTCKPASHKGRSLTLSLSQTYSRNASDNLSLYDTRYYKIKRNPDSVLVRHHFTDIDGHRMDLSAQLSLNEPLGRHLRLQLIYKVLWTDNYNSRQLYNWDDIAQKAATHLRELSSEGKYTGVEQLFSANMRYVKGKLNATAGLQWRPVSYTLEWPADDGAQSVGGHISSLSPYINLRYNRGKREHLILTVRSRTKPPGMYSLLPVVNGSNPQSIHVGNPYLRPTVTRTALFEYNRYVPKRRASASFTAEASADRDAVCNSTSYDPESGVRTVTPRNIDGNWTAAGSALVTKVFRDQRFSLTGHGAVSWRNEHNRLYDRSGHVDMDNTVTRAMARSRIQLSMRDSAYDLGISASGEYTRERSLLRPGMDREPRNISFGASISVKPAEGWILGSDYTLTAQRGFDSEGFDRNYNIWNASVSKSLAGGRCTLKLQYEDILGQQINLVRTYSAERRSVATFNGVNSYLMLRVIWNI